MFPRLIYPWWENAPLKGFQSDSNLLVSSRAMNTESLFPTYKDRNILAISINPSRSLVEIVKGSADAGKNCIALRYIKPHKSALPKVPSR